MPQQIIPKKYDNRNIEICRQNKLLATRLSSFMKQQCSYYKQLKTANFEEYEEAIEQIKVEHQKGSRGGKSCCP